MTWPLSQDYNEAIQDPRANFSDAELKTGEAVANALGIPMPRSGNFADVYEVRCPSGSRWAVKCFTREVFGLRERYAEIGKYLHLAKLPFMVDFKYLEQGIRVRGQWYPILKMQWVEGFLLNEFVRDNLDKKPILQALGQIWLRMAKRLRESYIAHCDLQHGNVLFVPGSSANSLAVKLIDYDGMCVPSLAGTKSGEVGHPAYQHPERLRSGAYDQEVDRFSLLSIAAALRCLAVGGRPLWERYDTGDNLLFRQADLQAPAESPLFQELLAIGDPQAKLLVTELHRACQGPLDAVPLLTDLLPDEKPAGKVTKTVSTSSSAVARQAGAAQGPDWDFGGEEPGASVVKKQPREARGMPVWTWGAIGGAAALVLLCVGVGVSLFMRKGSDEQGATPIAQHKPEKKPVQVPPKQPPDEIEANPAAKENPLIPRKDDNNPPAARPEPEPSIARRIFQLAPAGDMLALSDEGDNTWRLVNPRTNEVIREFKGHQDAISAMAFSADGSRALTGGHDKQMIVWDVKTGGIVRRLPSARAPLVSVALSPDGKRAAGTDITKQITVWDVQDGHGQSCGHSRNVRSVAFSSDGERFFCGQEKSDKSEEVVMISWPLRPGVAAHHFRGPSQTVKCIAVSPDGKYVAAGCSGQTRIVTVWETATRRFVRSYPIPMGSIHQVTFSPDSRFLLLTAGYRYYVWPVEPTNGRTGGIGAGNSSQDVIAATFTPDSKGVTSVSRKDDRVTPAQTVPLSTAFESVEVLTPIQAAAKAGQKVTVQLRVQGGGANEGFVELYSEPTWDRQGNMFLRFPESTRKKFQEIGIPNVGSHFSRKLIRVSGTVTILRFDAGTYPCIVIDDPDQIKELPGTAVAGNLPIDPDHDCKFTQADGKLTITVPAKFHVLHLGAKGMNSPRLLREVEGNFTAQVRVGGDFTPAAASTNGAKFSWIGAGLLLWVNDNTFLRLERAGVYERKPSTWYANWEVRQDGKMIDVKHNYPSLSEAATYLRLERRGKQILASYSVDGQNWSDVKPLDMELPAKVKIGVLAGSTTSRPFVPTFDQFQIKQGQGKWVRIDKWFAPFGTVSAAKLAWNAPVDPDGDCKFQETGGKLTIAVPAKPHSLSLDGKSVNAPRLVSDVEGDFTAQVRVNGDLTLAPASADGEKYNFIGAGLLLWVDENTFFRLERAVLSGQISRTYVNWEAREDGKQRETNHGFPALRAAATYLRLERRGKQILASHSADGQSWRDMKPLDIELPAKVQIGILACSTTARPVAPTFDQFQLKTGRGELVRVDWPSMVAAGAVVVTPPPRPRRRASNRTAVPNEATLADKQKEVRVMYRDDYKGMSKRGLASRLYEDSKRQSDAGLCYVMLKESCDLAALDGDLTVALRAASALGTRFDVDLLETKSRVLEKTLSAVPAKDKSTYRLLTQKALLFVDRAEIDENFDRGDRLLEIAKTAAAKADMSALLAKMVAKEEKQFKALREEHDTVKRFAEKLETDADDADANLALGRFRCFIRGDWDAGLPLLVKGNDKALSELAQQDVADPGDAAARAGLGDAWANRADKMLGKEQEACRRRAYSWYQDCLDDLDKKEQARVKARLTKLKSQLPELNRPFPDLDTGIATVNRTSRLLHLPPQHMIATRQLYRGPIDIRVAALLTKNSIRITFLNGGELVLRPENRTTKVLFYTPYGNDPDGQGFGSYAGSGPLLPGGVQPIRILVTANGWSFWINDKLVGNQNGSRSFPFASSPVRVWSDDGEIDIQSLVVKRVR